MLILILSLFWSFNTYSQSKADFTAIESQDNIVVSMAYNTENNFTLERIDGYFDNVCYLSKPAASQLFKVAQDLKEQGYGLFIFDCYRPQKGVDHFIRWAKAPEQPKSKQKYYPKLEKKNLFKLGYIAEKSGHSRGSTTDIGLYKLGKKEPIDMGTPFDFFEDTSHTASPKISKKAMANRMILKNAMEKHGFENYRKEWWHYTLKDEPYPKTYFNFDVKK